jgi:hypothetical protein
VSRGEAQVVYRRELGVRNKACCARQGLYTIDNPSSANEPWHEKYMSRSSFKGNEPTGLASAVYTDGSSGTGADDSHPVRE